MSNYFTRTVVNSAEAWFKARGYTDIKADIGRITIDTKAGYLDTKVSRFYVNGTKKLSEEQLRQTTNYMYAPFHLSFCVDQFPTCCGCMEVFGFTASGRQPDQTQLEYESMLERSVNFIHDLKIQAGYSQVMAILMSDYQAVFIKALLSVRFKVINEFQNQRTGHHLQVLGV